MCGGFGMLGLADLLAGDAFGAAVHTVGPHFAPRAKHVILLFMTGGPSQVDLFDPKPALVKYAGQRPATVDLRTERTTGGLLPCRSASRSTAGAASRSASCCRISATVADDLCVIRSMYTFNPNHEQARSMFHQGNMILSRPSMGSWISYGLGTENKNLPGFVVLAPDGGGFTTAGFLPAEYQGTSFNTFETAPDKMIRFLRNDTLNPDAQRAQLDLMQKLNHRARERLRAGRVPGRPHPVDGDRVPDAVRGDGRVRRHARAGVRARGVRHDAVRQGCLLARRLVESGVRFVVVHYGPGQPWDDHKKINENLRERCPDMDQASAALIRDLKRRGLLDETLVVWGGEFGRTPVSESGDGRDHNPYGFTMFMAGGGVKGGMTYGATDEFGFQAVENRVSIHDLHATILHLLGIDHEKLTYRYAGRDFRLTDVFGNVVRDILA